MFYMSTNTSEHRDKHSQLIILVLDMYLVGGSECRVLDMLLVP